MTIEIPPSIDIESWSLAAQLRSMVIPTLLMLAVVYVWLKICQRLCHKEDAVFDEHLALLDGASQSIEIALMARAHVGRGKPSDRLFFAGLALTSLAALAALVGFLASH